jgi:hypothetical protein
MIHPEAGQKKPFSGSFTEAVKFEFNFRTKNPEITKKNNWSLNIADIENDVDAYNAQRMVAGGFLNFVDLEGQSPPYVGGSSRGNVGVVAAAVSGLAVYRELFSNQSVPVARDEAERRAAICAACPQNAKGGLREFFVEAVAKGITELYGIMKDLELTTSRDKELGTCKACACPTRAKCWVALETINKHMKPAVKAKLDVGCWILDNSNAV